MDNDRYLQDIYRRVGKVAIEAARRANEQQAAQNRQLIQDLNKRIADLYRVPLDQMRASQAQLTGRVYESMVRSVNEQSFAAMNRAAAQAIASSHLTRVRIPDLINRQQLEDIIGRASKLAVSPHTQELLRRANEVAETMQPAAAQETEASLAELPDLPDLPQMQWVFMLDRESLVFLIKLLVHLTGILQPALGVAIAVSDREIDTEELITLLGMLHLMLVYAQTALNEKDGD